MFDKIKHAAKVLSTPAAPSAPQSTQTANLQKAANDVLRRLNAEAFMDGIEIEALPAAVGWLMDFAEAYASSRVASLQQELDHAKDERDYILERMCDARDTCLARAETAESKLSTLTGIASQLAYLLRQAQPIVRGKHSTLTYGPRSLVDFITEALEKFSDWEKTQATK